jgi:ABC-type uncharacterized transport system permease subunit
MILKVLWIRFLNQLRTELEYKANLGSAFIIETIYALFTFFYLGVIFSFVITINGWVLNDYIVYFLIANFSISIFDFAKPTIDDDIIEGELTNYLLRPISEFVFYPYLKISQLIFTLVHFILLVSFSLIYLNNIATINVLFSIILFICSLPILFLPQLMIRTLAFWFGRVKSLKNAYGSLIDNFDTIPITVISKAFFILLVILTPVSYLNWYIPTAMFLGKISLSYGLLMLIMIIGVDLLLLGLFLIIYKKGLKQYEGFGG